MEEEHTARAICPLIYFTTSKDLRKEIDQGIELLENVKIRRISEEDLKEVKGREIEDMMPGILSRLTTEAIVLEIGNIEDDPESEELLRKIENILLAMRLYKANQVFFKVIWLENSETRGLIFFDAHIPDLVTTRYSLEKKEIAGLRDLVKKIDLCDFDRNVSFRIACERFSRSYEKDEEDEIIIDFMIAFEALFLRGTTRLTNAGHFIGLGCSMLLGTNNEERENIKEFLVDAYKVRNDIVHGSQSVTYSIKVGKRTYEIEDIVLKLRDYLRQSIKKLI